MVDIIKKRVWSDGRQLFAPVSTELQKTKNICHNPNHQQTLTFYQKKCSAGEEYTGGTDREGNSLAVRFPRKKLVEGSSETAVLNVADTASRN